MGTRVPIDFTREEYELMSCIANRALDAFKAGDKLTWMMDIQVVHGNVGLQLKELLAAELGDFMHDLGGIATNLNRATMQLENCFLPRYAVQ